MHSLYKTLQWLRGIKGAMAIHIPYEMRSDSERFQEISIHILENDTPKMIQVLYDDTSMMIQVWLVVITN